MARAIERTSKPCASIGAVICWRDRLFGFVRRRRAAKPIHQQWNRGAASGFCLPLIGRLCRCGFSRLPARAGGAQICRRQNARRWVTQTCPGRRFGLAPQRRREEQCRRPPSAVAGTALPEDWPVGNRMHRRHSSHDLSKGCASSRGPHIAGRFRISGGPCLEGRRTFDDLIDVVAEELPDLSALVSREQKREREATPAH